MRKLGNRYFALRHGHSSPNELGIILSDPQDGRLEEFSLTPKGQGQVRVSVTRAKEEGWINQRTLLVTSPFSRCVKSVVIAQQILGAKAVVFDCRLRERWFGNWERQPNFNYQKVWDIDAHNPDHTDNLVESASTVQKRVAEVVVRLEQVHQGRTVLLVSHGDALQILQTWFCEVSPALHRQLPHLETAEIRLLNQEKARTAS